MTVHFRPRGDDLVGVEFDLHGFGSGVEIVTVEQAKAIRDELERCIEVQGK